MNHWIFKQMNKFFVKKVIYPTFLILLAANVFVWHSILFAGGAENLELYFLDVGQGDGQLVVLPGGVQILIDGGTGPQVLSQLEKVMPPHDRYIDLVVLTHPQMDHFGGLIDVLKTYQVGAFIDNGREGTAKAYSDLRAVLEQNGARHLVLQAGDVIKYSGAEFKVLNPNKNTLVSKELNDTSLVMFFKKEGLRVLYTGDIGFNVERELVAKYDLNADVLKVGHHGSKYASGKDFLAEVSPAVSIIGVGKNSYGHPTKETLARLANAGSQIYRTDTDSIIKLTFDGKQLKVYR